MEISKRFSFDAAHYLSDSWDDPRFRQMHGHTYYVRIAYRGEVDPITRAILPFAKVDEIVDSVLQVVDHSVLNETLDTENPTIESVGVWLLREISFKLRGVVKVEVWRGANEEGCSVDIADLN